MLTTPALTLAMPLKGAVSSSVDSGSVPLLASSSRVA
jgi:hypothetical protein